MSTFEIVLVAFAAVLALAALGVVYRMIVGPTILDRALASDSLVTLVVMGMAIYAATTPANWAGPAMLGLTGLAFIGTVTFARFVAREDSRQGTLRAHRDEPATDTAPHEAIHLDQLAAPAGAATGGIPSVDLRDAAAPVGRPAEPGSSDPSAGSTGADAPSTQTERQEAPSDSSEDSVAGDGSFGAEGAGSRGFGDEGRSRWPDEPTEETR